MKDKIARLQAWQKLFKEKVIDNKSFQRFQKAVYGLTLLWAGYLFFQSMPYYQQIGEGESYYKKGDYKSARVAFEKALEQCKHFAGDWSMDPRSIRAMNNLAEDYRLLGMYSQAEPLYRETVACARKKFAATRPELAIALNNLAMLQREEGHYDDSDKSYTEALNLWQNKVKQNDSKLANIENGLAKLRQDQGRYSEAEKLYLQALDVNQKALGKSDVANSYILSSLGGLYCDLGRYKDAESYFRQALYLDQHGLKADHPDLASDMHDLGYLMRLQGRTTDARPFYKKALAIRMLSLGESHPLTAKCYTGLADLERREGHYTEAQNLLNKALLVQGTALGSAHPSFADSLDVEGLNYLDQGKLDMARICFGRAQTIRKNLLAPSHPDLLTSNFYLALCDQKASREPQHQQALYNTVQSLEKVLGTSHPTVVMAKQLSGMATG